MYIFTKIRYCKIRKTKQTATHSKGGTEYVIQRRSEGGAGDVLGH